ncbi:Uncharacterised protein [Vibrio cholerae]|nr:Uncharacterised protein [Vibrio cholerae]CSI40831.1 Uncharacterised protein [Vibrio cholerae]
MGLLINIDPRGTKRCLNRVTPILDGHIFQNI